MGFSERMRAKLAERKAAHEAAVVEMTERLRRRLEIEGRFEILDDAYSFHECVSLMVRRESLVKAMAKATPFSARYNELSEAIVVDCEQYLATYGLV